MADIRKIVFRRPVCFYPILLFIFCAATVTAFADESLTLDLEPGSVRISWTAPGDDHNIGTAASYDIRYTKYAPGSDTTYWWERCLRVSDEPQPLPAGERQSYEVTGLEEGEQYYFAMKAVDEAGNWSEMSNIASTVFDFYYCADTDGDGRFSILDMIFLRDYLFWMGPEPAPDTGDVNNDGVVNILDLLFLIDYSHFDGPPPDCG